MLSAIANFGRAKYLTGFFERCDQNGWDADEIISQNGWEDLILIPIGRDL